VSGVSPMAESTDVDVEGLDSATGSSSCRDSHSCWMGSLWLVRKEEFAKKNLGSLFLPLELSEQRNLRR